MYFLFFPSTASKSQYFGTQKTGRTLGGCEVGHAKISSGHRLPAETVIHVVGPIGEQEAKLSSCYREILEIVMKYRLKNVAICGISTGIYGYPLQKAARVALKTTREWLNNNKMNKIEKIVFVAYLKEEEVVYSKLISEYFPL